MLRKGKVNTRTLTLTCVEKSWAVDKLLKNRRLPMWTLEKPMLTLEKLMLDPGNTKHSYP